MSFETTDGNTLVSFASMLVTTNDAFIGASGLDVSTSRAINLNAYDSGSEANSESCAYIPGPPCGNHADDEALCERNPTPTMPFGGKREVGSRTNLVRLPTLCLYRRPHAAALVS